ncbi:MAG: divalent-cation tolerance protein CutA [Anaerolineae bacterium]|nr:divalent-cation tolerance protein CutA [Anaerolineae bacterium]
MPINEHIVVLVTATDEKQARQIARRLLREKLAACVNFVPVESMFLWKGDIQEEEEVLMIIKTRTETFDALMSAVKIVHSYDTPEIIGMPIVMGSREYLKWITDEATGK